MRKVLSVIPVKCYCLNHRDNISSSGFDLDGEEQGFVVVCIFALNIIYYTISRNFFDVIFLAVYCISRALS